MKYSILLLFIFFSCSNKENIRKSVAKLKLSPITFPANIRLTLNGKKYVDENLITDGVKFIVYVDSMECSSCAINKMDTWIPYINYATVVLNKELTFYFIITPKKSQITSVEMSLATYKINYPVIIDYDGEFEHLNSHLPKNRALHTFLLDKNNNVVMIGDPRYSNKIEKLFYKKTQELLSK